MPKMNGTGPEGKGPRTGRGLGKCNNIAPEDIEKQIGKGMGKRHKSGGGKGKEKRLQYYS